MIFLKHFRHYYIKYGFYFLLGIAILVLIDWFQLEIPRMMGVIVDSVREGTIYETSQMIEPILYISTIVIGITIGRFLWRYLLFGNGRKIETDIRFHMFEHATK